MNGGNHDERRARWTGALLTTAMVAALLVAYGITSPQPLAASACCQTCDALEMACYAACDRDALNEPSLSTCYDHCVDELYYQSYGCWANCVWCSPPAPDPVPCWEYTTYCAEWENENCLEWVFMVYQVYSGWCEQW